MENESTEPQAAAPSAEELAVSRMDMAVIDALSDGPATIGQIRKAVGIPNPKALPLAEKAMRRELKRLASAGTITTTGQRRGTRYSLARKPEAAE